MSPRTQAVLIGGAFNGVLSALPIVSIGNLCCCLWVVGGGVMAVYLLQQSHPQPLDVQDGAFVGFLAGVFGAFVSMLVYIPFQIVLGPVIKQEMEKLRERNADLPPEVVELIGALGGYADGSAGFGYFILLIGSFMMALIIGALFSTFGGMLGVVLFGRDRQKNLEIST